jgi:hypothetical protein
MPQLGLQQTWPPWQTFWPHGTSLAAASSPSPSGVSIFSGPRLQPANISTQPITLEIVRIVAPGFARG